MSTNPDALPAFVSSETLLPVIVQDELGEVLMLAWMNAESYRETCETGRACYFSRSRKSLWRKGETSGHVQHVLNVFVDCDGDAILLRVRQEGPACHEGYHSCFFRERIAAEWVVRGTRMI